MQLPHKIPNCTAHHHSDPLALFSNLQEDSTLFLLPESPCTHRYPEKPGMVSKQDHPLKGKDAKICFLIQKTGNWLQTLEVEVEPI